MPACRHSRSGSVAIYSDVDVLVRDAAEHVIARARAANEARGRFAIALSGGSTPRPLYAWLATPAIASRVDWRRWHVFWGDERCVPPDDAESNYRMAREALLDRVPIPPDHVHRIAGEDEPNAAASTYERTLQAFFGGGAGPPERSFDLALLGMGDDGHTASLFPGTPPLAEQRRWVVGNRGPRGAWRVTLTPVVLNASDAIVFLVTGPSKAERLWEVFEGPPLSPPLPVQQIRPRHGALTWMIDSDAAGRLRGAS